MLSIAAHASKASTPCSISMQPTKRLVGFGCSELALLQPPMLASAAAELSFLASAVRLSRSS